MSYSANTSAYQSFDTHHTWLLNSPRGLHIYVIRHDRSYHGASAANIINGGFFHDIGHLTTEFHNEC